MEHSFRNSKNLVSSFRATHHRKQAFNLQNIINQCKKSYIKCQKLVYTELESAIGFVSMRAYLQKNKNYKTIHVFISQLKHPKISVSTFFNGLQIQKQQVSNQLDISKIIIKSLDKISSKPQAIPQKHYMHKYNDDKISKLYQKLADKCNSITKNQKNQEIMIQQLKISRQYQQTLKYLKDMNLDLQQLSQRINSLQKQVNQNQLVLSIILTLQNQKYQLDTKILQYDNTRNSVYDIKGRLDDFINNQRDKIQKMDFYDEDSFSRYCQELKKLKKLEYQKKFLN